MMCEECVKKLNGKPFVHASPYRFKEFKYCVNRQCMKQGTLVVTLCLPERK